MNNLSPKRTTKTHVANAFNRLSSIGEISNRVRWDDPPVEKFYDGFAEDLKAHPSIQKFESPEVLAKSYVELEKKISAKGIIIPDEKAKPDSPEVKAYRTALGIPETADKYTFDKIEGIDERLAGSEEGMKAVKEMMFKNGIPAKAAQGVYKDYMAMQANALKQYDESKKTEMDKATTELRGEWGAKFDEKIAGAKKLIKAFGDDKLVEFLEQGEGNNPYLIRMFAKIAEKLGEDALGAKGAGDMQTTPDQAKIEIDKIKADTKHAYWDENNPTHDEAVKKMTALYKIAYPGKKVGA